MGILTAMASRPGAGGGGGGAVHLSDRTWANDSATAPAHSGYELSTAGGLYRSEADGGSATFTYQSYDWLTSGTNSDYDVRFTKTSGATPTMSGSATLATWLNLGTTRYIGYSSSSGEETGTFTVEIATAIDHATILASCTVVLTATYTGGGSTVQLSNQTWNNLSATAPAHSGYKLDSTGKLYRCQTDGGSPTWTYQSYDWLISGAAADYDVRFTQASGDAPDMSGSASIGVWLSLGTSRHIGFSDSGGGDSGSFTVDIAAASDHGTILATATVSLSATFTGI